VSRSVKHGTLTGKAPQPFTHKGKGGAQVLLPARRAVHQLLKGAPADRTLLDYGELTPTGRKAPGSYAGIQKIGEPKITDE
jgi:hypothetical protein